VVEEMEDRTGVDLAFLRDDSAGARQHNDDSQKSQANPHSGKVSDNLAWGEEFHSTLLDRPL